MNKKKKPYRVTEKFDTTYRVTAKIDTIWHLLDRGGSGFSTMAAVKETRHINNTSTNHSIQGIETTGNCYNITMATWANCQSDR